MRSSSNETKKPPQGFLQPHHQEHYANRRRTGNREFLQEARETVFALPDAELSLNLHSIRFVLALLLHLRPERFAVTFRSARRGLAQPNPKLFAVLNVAAVAIQLVGVHRGRIMTKAILELFYLPFEVARLVEEENTIHR